MSDRKSLIRLASTLSKGSKERRAILAGLKQGTRVGSVRTAGLQFVDGKHPNGRGRRFKLVDTSAPDITNENQFADQFDWYGLRGQRLKRPKLIFRGEHDDPKTVSYIDYSGSSGDLYISKIATRSTHGGKGLSQKLIAEFYKQKFPGKKGWVNWGKLLNKTSLHIFMKFLKAYPDVKHKGIDFANTGVGRGILSP